MQPIIALLQWLSLTSVLTHEYNNTTSFELRRHICVSDIIELPCRGQFSDDAGTYHSPLELMKDILHRVANLEMEDFLPADAAS